MPSWILILTGAAGAFVAEHFLIPWVANHLRTLRLFLIWYRNESAPVFVDPAVAEATTEPTVPKLRRPVQAGIVREGEVYDVQKPRDADEVIEQKSRYAPWRRYARGR